MATKTYRCPECGYKSETWFTHVIRCGVADDQLIRTPWEQEWAVIDLGLLAQVQETVGRLRTKLPADDPIKEPLRRLGRDLKALRRSAIFLPDEHEVLEELALTSRKDC